MLDGRLRVDLGDIRGGGRFARDTLRTIPGVRDVTVDPDTGRVEIVYEPLDDLRPARAVEPDVSLEPEAVAPEPCPTLPATSPRATPLLEGIVQTVVVIALEVALERVLGPFFWPRRR
jgi:hypothetical protein